MVRAWVGWVVYVSFSMICYFCVWPGMVFNQRQLSIVVPDWEPYLGSLLCIVGCGWLFLFRLRSFCRFIVICSLLKYYIKMDNHYAAFTSLSPDDKRYIRAFLSTFILLAASPRIPLTFFKRRRERAEKRGERTQELSKSNWEKAARSQKDTLGHPLLNYITSPKFGHTYSFRVFLYFYHLLHCRIVTTLQLWNNTYGIM